MFKWKQTKVILIKQTSKHFFFFFGGDGLVAKSF